MKKKMEPSGRKVLQVPGIRGAVVPAWGKVLATEVFATSNFFKKVWSPLFLSYLQDGARLGGKKAGGGSRTR